MVPVIVLMFIPVMLGLTILEMVTDGLRKTGRFAFHDTITNLACGVSSQAINLFVNVVLIWLYVVIWSWVWRPSLDVMAIDQAMVKVLIEEWQAWPWTYWLWVIPGLIIFDLAFYWEHRISHEVNFFWGTHVVHHSSEEYNLSIALRKSWISSVIIFMFFLPIPFMGFHPAIFVTCMALHNLWQYIIHTKAIDKMHPWIEAVMHTPSHHRVHHGRDPKYIDTNYSGVFIFWDKLFGTFQPEEEEPTYGITKPLHTNNPGMVNLHYYLDLYHNLKRMPSWRLKLKMLFARPGWFPEEMGGYQAAPPVDKKRFRKYQSPSPRPLNQYVLVQFLMVTALMLTVIVVKINTFAPADQLMIFAVLFASSVIPVALFDLQPWSGRMEFLRLTALPVLIGIFTWRYRPEWLWTVTGSSILLFGGMALWFWWVWRQREEVEMNPSTT